MRDVRDWNKYVEMVGKTVSKRPVSTHPGPAVDTAPGHVEQSVVTDHAPIPVSPDGFLPTRKGRGPRKEETGKNCCPACLIRL